MLSTILDRTVGVRAQLKVCEESGSADRQEIYSTIYQFCSMTSYQTSAKSLPISKEQKAILQKWTQRQGERKTLCSK